MIQEFISDGQTDCLTGLRGRLFCPLELSRLCAAIAPSPTLAIDAKAKEMRQSGRDVVSFSVGEPDFVTPQYIRTAAHEALDMGLTKYTPAAGTLGLAPRDLRKAALG